METTRECTRALKEQVEDKATIKIRAGIPVLERMLRWAAMLRLRFLVGNGGRTAHERRRGRKCNTEVVPFGESVRCKVTREGQARKNTLDSDWNDGVRLGHSWTRNEVVAGADAGVVRAFTTPRKAEGDRWNRGQLKKG